MFRNLSVALFSLLWVVLPLGSYAQDGVSQAQRLLGEQRFGAAAMIFADLAKAQLGANDLEAAVHYLHESAQSYARIPDYGQSLKTLDEAIKLAEKNRGSDSTLVQLYCDKSNWHRKLGEREDARESLLKAGHCAASLTGPHDALIALAYQQGLQDLEDEKWEAGISKLRRGIQQFEALGGHPLTLNYYNDLGFALRQTGKSGEARVYYEKALSIFQASQPKDYSLLATIQNNLAYIHGLEGRSAKKFELILLSTRIREKHLGARHPEVADAYNNLAQEYWLHKKMLDSALVYIDKCILINQQLGEYRRSAVALALHNKAYLYAAAGQLEAAIPLEKRSLALVREKERDYSPQLAARYINLGSFQLRLQHWEEAGEAMQQAVITTARGFNDPSLAASPHASQMSWSNHHFEALRNKGNYLIRRYKTEKDRQWLEAARTNFELLDSLLRNYRFLIYDELGYKKMLNFANNCYRALLFICHHLNEKDSYTLRSLDYAEQLRSVHLLRNLIRRESLHFAGIPDTVLGRDRALKMEYEVLSRQLEKAWEANDSVRIDQLGDQRFRCFEELQALREKMRRDHPGLDAFRYNQGQVDLAELQSVLQQQQSSIIEYTLAHPHLYIHLITPDSLFLLYRSLPNRLKPSIDSLRWHLEARSRGLGSYARSLSVLLYEPLVAKIPTERLLIIPDQELYYLPFELLLTTTVDSSLSDPHYRHWPFLLREKRISYQFSSNLILRNSRQKKQYRSAMLALSPSSLPAARREVQELERQFGGTFLYDEEASKAHFFQQAARHGLLHLATHAVMDPQDPGASYIQLAGETNDTRLYAYELYNSRLDAQLVVLSACETGHGKLQKGEGMRSLAQAFAYAGSPNLLSNQWMVPDQSSAEVMVEFYRQLKAGLPKDEALRRAKLAYLDQAKALVSHPYFWAGSYLIGDPAPLRTVRFTYRWLLLLILPIGAWLFWRRFHLR